MNENKNTLLWLEEGAHCNPKISEFTSTQRGPLPACTVRMMLWVNREGVHGAKSLAQPTNYAISFDKSGFLVDFCKVTV